MISRETVLSSHGPDPSSRETVYLRATRDPSSRETVRNFARNPATALYFSAFDFSSFRIFATNCSWFHIFVFSDLLEQHSSELETKLDIVENFYFLVSFSLAPMVSHHGLSS